MEEIYLKILALYFICKDVHYLALQKRRWDIHKQTDKIADNLIEWLDEIQEKHFIPVKRSFLYSAEIFKKLEGENKPSDLDKGLDVIKKHIVELLNLITKIVNDETIGSANLISGFAESLQQKLAFVGG